MSKKKIVLLPICSIIVLILAIIVIINLMSNKNINYKIIDKIYISNFDSSIVTNIDEYNNFVKNYIGNDKEKFLDKYTENYFKNKSLVLKFIITGNGSTRLANVDLSTIGNSLIIGYGIYDPHTPQDDITGALLIVEVNKNITNIVDEF